MEFVQVYMVVRFLVAQAKCLSCSRKFCGINECSSLYGSIVEATISMKWFFIQRKGKKDEKPLP